MIRDDSTSMEAAALSPVLPQSLAAASSTNLNTNKHDGPDLMEVLYDKEPKSTDLRISCMICGDRASGFHYGVHACEGCKGFFRRTVRMRLKYKECQIGCKVNVKSRNKCQYCRFQKCLKSGMSHDAIRFGRMSRVEKNRIITKMAKEEPGLLNRKRIEAEQKNLKKLSETILKAFQKHFSMTREKMSALWRERSLPGITAPYLDTLEDVKILYPQLFAGGLRNQSSSMGTAQFESSSAKPGFDHPNGSLNHGGNNSHDLLLPDDISFSSASSDSGSDELLSAVKKITIPYPQYENINMTPGFPSTYQGMPSEVLQEFKDEPYVLGDLWSAGESSNSSQHGLVSGSPSAADNFSYEVTGRRYSIMQDRMCGSGQQEVQEASADADMDAILYTELKAVFEPDGEEDMAVGILKKIEVGLQNKMDVDQLFEEFPGFRNFFRRLNISTEYLKKFVAEMPTYGLHSFMECARQAHVQRLLEKKLKSGRDTESANAASTSAMVAGKPRPFTTLLEDTNAAKSIGMQIVKFLYQNMQKRFVKGVCELTEFSKNIPGFCELTLSDQVILLKYGSYEVLFVMLGAMIFSKGMLLPEGNVYVTFDFVNKLGDVGLLMKPKFEFAEKIASMNLQDEELSLFAAAIILFGDRPGLNEREKVEEVQSEILKTLEMQLKISHPNDSQLFARLLLKMTDLRQLVADHVTMVERLIKIHSIKKLFHPLIREIIKDRD